MDQREIEVTVLSAQDLKNVKLSGGMMSPYVVAWIYPNMKVPSPVSTKGGINPTWNSVLRLLCEESLLQQGGANLTVEILNHGSFSNKAIGTVRIPLSSVSSKAGQGSSSADSTKSSSYQIRRPSGKVQGMLNVSVKLGEVVRAAAAASWVAPNLATSSDRSNGNTPMTAYPAAAGYPMGAGQYPQQNQQYYQPAPYYQQGYAQQAPARTRRSRFGGAGLGTGLLGGALGGMLLGSAMDGGDGGGDGGGGGCGGGGGGGGCGGGGGGGCGGG